MDSQIVFRLLCRARQLCFLAIAGWIAITPKIFAQSGTYGISKAAFFTQSSASPPPPSTSWDFSGNLFTAALGEVIAAEVETPTGQRLMDTGDGFLFFSGPSYPTLVALDAAFPNGAYTFRITAGTLAPASASVSFPGTNMFPSAVPAFDAETVAALSSYDACKAFLFAWNGFVPDANATRSSARLSISQSPFGGPVFFGSADGNSMTVRGGLLKPNTAYRATLSFSNERRTPNAGFGNFDSAVSFSYFTDFEFTTLPETATDQLAIRVSQVELCWATATNGLYQLQYRSSLSENEWNDVGLPIQGTGFCRCVYQDVVQGRPQRFYRVVTLPQ